MNFHVTGQGELVMCYVIGMTVLGAIVNIAFTLGVFWVASGRRTELVPYEIWVLATLLGGPLVAGVYWVIHESSLAKPTANGGENRENEEEGEMSNEGGGG